MTSGVTPIGTFELFLATAFVAVAGALSIALSLGIGRSLAVATVRTYVQLLALGIVLRWVFRVDTPLLVLFVLFVMMLSASHILLERVRSGPPKLWSSAFVSIFISGATVTFAVTALVIGVRPWHKAQYVLPIAGMILGNSMTGISLALERLFSELRRRSDEVWVRIALGATPWESALPAIRACLTAALIPTINSMNAVGIVSIPGMMTGQILSGTDPALAARYQIVVMLMLSAATALGAMLAVLCFWRTGALTPPTGAWCYPQMEKDGPEAVPLRSHATPDRFAAARRSSCSDVRTSSPTWRPGRLRCHRRP